MKTEPAEGNPMKPDDDLPERGRRGALRPGGSGTLATILTRSHPAEHGPTDRRQRKRPGSNRQQVGTSRGARWETPPHLRRKTGRGSNSLPDDGDEVAETQNQGGDP